MELLRNELFKIFCRKRIFIAFVLILLIIYVPYYKGELDYINKNYGSIEQLKQEFKKHEGKINSNDTIIKSQLQGEEDKDYSDKSKNIKRNIKLEYTAQSKPMLIAIYDFVKLADKPFIDVEGRFIQGRVFDFEPYSMKELAKEIDNLKKNKKDEEFEYKNKILANSMYKKVMQREFNYCDGWNMIVVNYEKLTPYLIVLFIILGVSSVFASDYEDNVYQIVMASKNGRTKAVFAKVGAVIIYSIVVVLMLSGINILVNGILYGLDGVNAPIQCLYGFWSSPYKLTIGQFLFRSIIITITGTILLAFITMIISNISKSSITTSFIIVVMYAIPIILTILIKYSWQKCIGNLSINKIISAMQIYSFFSTSNLFGQPIKYELFIICLSILQIMIILYFLIRISNKRCGNYSEDSRLIYLVKKFK
ncbi:hypothetical protein SAMN02745163_02560 [Clostridium cavendishii DSM 21758]|uniref:ABC-2 type transporter transmembrane domain-containing protein n=1 Tax=Clostridium cavendishii DSM 21758 TaxID=1121302 RepID=A0A1M6M185_9CLOT|nr:hypothetical protein [Clostridium cavendishii]SHJ77198.1 hypothetical protein SAMN02745163_02560 [Clostridium cavendishii DSM 21758]